ERPDVIHNNTWYPAVFDHRDAAPRFVTTLHTPPIPELAARLSSLGGPPIPLVTPSATSSAAWRAAGVETQTILNGVDRGVFRFGRGEGGHLVWTGRVVPEKAPHLAIDAARQLGIPLFLAGPAHD